MNVIRIRKQLKMTQEQLASALGVSSRQVNRWEHQRYKPSPLAQAALQRLLEQHQHEAPEVVEVSA